MAETPRMLALRAAVLAGYFMATLSAVGDLFGEDTDQFPPFEAVPYHRLVALFYALAFVIGELAARFQVPETSDEYKQFQEPMGHMWSVMHHINNMVQERACAVD